MSAAGPPQGARPPGGAARSDARGEHANSSFLGRVTAMILTYNEAPNIARTLAKLGAFARIVVIDSGSDDATREIVERHPNTRLVVRPFDTFAAQWNFGLAQLPPDADWVMSLDADFVLSDELVQELSALSPADDVAGYRAAFRCCVYGQPIRSGVYPPLTVLYRRRLARFVEDGHSQRLILDGRVEALAHRIFHDDRKPLARWLDAQRSYARLDADHLESADGGELALQDRVRSWIFVAPFAMLVYVYLFRGGILDGWRGLYYALQRAYAELGLSLELLDRRLRRKS